MNGVYCGHKGSSQIFYFSSFWAMTGIPFPSLELGGSLQEQHTTWPVSPPYGSDDGAR